MRDPLSVPTTRTGWVLDQRMKDALAFVVSNSNWVS